MNTDDRYAKIREALEMGPTPGPFSASRSYSPGNQELILRLTYEDEYGFTEDYCTVRNRLGDTWKTEANAAYIAACDPDTIRELLAERDALAARDAELVAVKAALSGDTGELIDKMAEAIRDDGEHYDEAPWDILSEERKEGWRSDARRALAVVKEYLTTEGHVILPKPEARLREALEQIEQQLDYGQIDTALHITRAALKEDSDERAK